MLPRMRGLAVLAAFAVTAPGRAEANMANPHRGGSLAGEPEGTGAITILREDLVIDLRSLTSDDGLVAVTATYHLDNPSGEKHLDLVFATGSAAVGFRVMLDGRPVPSGLYSGAALPESWRPPNSTPGIGGGERGYEIEDRARPMGFRLTMPPGLHELTVSYGADAVRYHAGEAAVLRQFAYVLSPARAWGGFGGLEVQVRVPPGWRAAVTPALTREGDTLRGSFASVPADTIGITVQAPTGAFAAVRYAAGALLAIVVLGGGFFVAWWSRARERRRPDALSASRLAAFGRGVVWGAAILAAGWLAIVGPELVLAEGQADRRSYGDALALVGVVLLSLLAVPIGTIVSVVAGRRVHASHGKAR